MQQLPLLAFVGGFLGAGKTTLILKAARQLQVRGMRVAVITNDQDSSLVDTAHARAEDVLTREVAGGCFCCRFTDLIEASEELRAYSPDVIFAEPVGSCVDLSATILQPLKAYYRGTFRVAPLTVLIDPSAAAKLVRDDADGDMRFLFEQQLAEADLVCVTKQDLHPRALSLAFPVDFELSAITGVGVDAWLDEVLDSKRVVGARLLEVDYARYARAEAALGWLNLHADIDLPAPVSPALLCGPLLDRIDELLTAQAIRIAHLKFFDSCLTGWLRVSVTENGASPDPQGDLLAEAAGAHQLALNLRAVAEPDELQRIIERALGEITGTVTIRHLRAFRPAEPVPEHRFLRLAEDRPA